MNVTLSGPLLTKVLNQYSSKSLGHDQNDTQVQQLIQNTLEQINSDEYLQV